jgi:hypothetical protein
MTGSHRPAHDRPTVSLRRPRDWPLLLMVVATALVTEVGLRATTLPRLARFLGVPLSTAPPTQGLLADVLRPLPQWALRRHRAVGLVMGHWPLGDTCLRSALVTGCQLRVLGPELRVGVAKMDGQVRAHAWVEVAGRALDPLGAAQYAPVESVRR